MPVVLNNGITMTVLDIEHYGCDRPHINVILFGRSRQLWITGHSSSDGSSVLAHKFLIYVLRYSTRLASFTLSQCWCRYWLMLLFPSHLSGSRNYTKSMTRGQYDRHMFWECSSECVETGWEWDITSRAKFLQTLFVILHQWGIR